MGVDSRSPMDQFAAHLDRGWDLIARGDLAGAVLSARKCLELDENSAEAHNLMGYACAAEGRAEEAVEHYRRAIEIEDLFVEAMLNAAEVLIHPLGDYAAALELVDEALDLSEYDDEITDALLLKFDALFFDGKLDEAKAVLRKLPEIPEGKVELDFRVGRAKYEVGDAKGALEHLQRATAGERPSGDALYYLGLAFDADRQARDASIAFLRAREADLSAGPAPWAVPIEEFERRVQTILQNLPGDRGKPFADTLVFSSDVPGPEVVADGVDPRALVLFEDISQPDAEPRVGRVFVYQRNVERTGPDAAVGDVELRRAIDHELEALWPTSFKPSASDGPDAEPPTAVDEPETRKN